MLFGRRSLDIRRTCPSRYRSRLLLRMLLSRDDLQHFKVGDFVLPFNTKDFTQATNMKAAWISLLFAVCYPCVCAIQYDDTSKRMTHLQFRMPGSCCAIPFLWVFQRMLTFCLAARSVPNKLLNTMELKYEKFSPCQALATEEDLDFLSIVARKHCVFTMMLRSRVFRENVRNKLHLFLRMWTKGASST